MNHSITLHSKYYVGCINIEKNYKDYIQYLRNHYNSEFLNYIPQELIDLIITKLCYSLIVVITDDNKIQYINTDDYKIIKEVPLTNNIKYTNISPDGRYLISDSLIIEHNNNQYTQKIHNMNINHDEEYFHPVSQKFCVNNSVTYFINCEVINNKLNIGLFNVMNNILTNQTQCVNNYIINADYALNICFSNDDTLLSIITIKDDDCCLYIFNITSNTFELIYTDNTYIISNYSMEFSPNNKYLLVNSNTNGFHYTNATYTTLIDIETKERKHTYITDRIIKWKNNDSFSYVENNKIITINIPTCSSSSYQFINTCPDYYIDNIYYTNEKLIIKYTNNFEDNMIIIN